MSDWLLLFLNKLEKLPRILSSLERALKFLPENCLLDQTANCMRQSVTLRSHSVKLVNSNPLLNRIVCVTFSLYIYIFKIYLFLAAQALRCCVLTLLMAARAAL